VSRIGTNLASLIAQRVFTANTKAINQTLERLSTGYRINRGGDDPAGLVASESLRARSAAISAALANAQRADQFVTVADGALEEISGMLVDIQGLVTEAAGAAGDEGVIKTAQTQIDALVASIDRLAGGTSFAGSRIFTGSFDYSLTAGGTAADGFASVRVYGAPPATAASPTKVSVQVVASAQQGVVALSAGPGGQLMNQGQSAVSFEFSTARGAQTLVFAELTDVADMRDQINSVSDFTGVNASLSGNLIVLRSADFGSEAFVRVREVANANTDRSFIRAVSDDGSVIAGVVKDQTDAGRDATLTVNGRSITTQGLEARFVGNGLDIAMTLVGQGANSFNQAGAARQFGIAGGGAAFQLSPDIGALGRVSIGIPTVNSSNLGNGAIGYLTALRADGASNISGGNFGDAQAILDEAISQVSSLRGRLGGFSKYTLGSTISSLEVTLENTMAAESAIRETDYARDTALLNRQQVMMEASVQALSLSNTMPQMVLRLLGVS
jgi:flagellin